jgi:3-polyprenyl-4-hydroxybenzoate decarboxylase
MRAYQDLREFLSVPEQERQLLRIADPVKLSLTSLPPPVR